MKDCNKTGMTWCPNKNCPLEQKLEARGRNLRAQPSCLCYLFQPLLLFEALQVLTVVGRFRFLPFAPSFLFPVFPLRGFLLHCSILKYTELMCFMRS